MQKIQNPLTLLVRKLQQHVFISEDDCQAILDLPFTLRTLEASSYIVREGDIPEFCPVLLSGFAFRQKLAGDGARQIVSLHVPGEALDFQHLFLDVADHNVQLLTRAELAFIPRANLLLLARTNKTIAQAILVQTLIEGSIFREWVLNVGRRDARTRVSHVLCEFALRLDAQQIAEEYLFELPMTQDQLADVVGLTPVHVNRTLQALESEGLIARSRRQVRIPDWDRLREVGDFNQRYLHLDRQGSNAPEEQGRQRMAAC